MHPWHAPPPAQVIHCRFAMLGAAGCFAPEYGFLAGLATADAAEPVREHLERTGVLVRSATIDHRFPVCWRCGTDLIFRVVEEWFIRAEPVRQAMIDAAAMESDFASPSMMVCTGQDSCGARLPSTRASATPSICPTACAMAHIVACRMLSRSMR